MEKGSEISPSRRFCHWLIRRWFALTGRKIRGLQAGDVIAEGPVLFAVSHPPGLLPAVVLATALEPGVRCLLPASLARGRLARFLARGIGVILHQGGEPTSESTLGEAIDVLSEGGTLAVFADQTDPGRPAPGTLATTAAALVRRWEAQYKGHRVTVHPVHLFLPEPAAQSREILIYVDSVVTRPEGGSTPPSTEAQAQNLVAALESRFQENAFQLRPADLEYFLGDLEEVLRAGLQEDWASRPDWKQDAEGFLLSRSVTGWAKQTNYLNPGRLVTLRHSVEDYRRLQRQCALRELQVQEASSLLQPGWRRAVFWLETVLGLPIALYGLVNHLVIGLALFLAGSFKRNNARARSTEWTLRGAVTLAFYVAQILVVARGWGRAAAGYYAPTLPVSGAYLWRYWRLVRHHEGVLFLSLTIPGLKRRIRRLRHGLLEGIDQALESYR